MTLPIILLSVLALALGTLSVVLSLLVGRRYHQINRENSRTLNEFRDELRTHSQLHRSHTRSIANTDAEISIQRQLLSRIDESTGGLWKTGIGTIVQIRQMSDNHLGQALAHLEETGREGSQAWRDMRNEQRRRRHDKKMSATTPLQEFNKALLGNPMIVAKGTQTLEQIGACMGTENKDASPVDRAIARLIKSVSNGDGISDSVEFLRGFYKEPKDDIDWFEVTRIIDSLISRTGLSKGLNSDLWKLKHLLARGRKA